MKIPRLAVFFGSLAIGAHAGAQVVAPDIDGDCEVDGADLGLILAQWGDCASPCSADLNGDQTVDGADLGLYYANYDADCPAFEFHMNLVGWGADEVTLDSSLEAITQRDVKIFPEQFYGFAVSGLHKAFGANGDYSDWEDFHEAFLASYEAAIETFLLDDTSPHVGLPTSYDEYAVIDFEAFRPVWEENVSDVKTPWWTCISDINSPHWDNDFITAIGYTPPTGITGYGGLNGTQRTAFAKQSFDYFARELFELQLNTGRATLPDAKWGYYAYPRGVFWNGGSVGYSTAQKGYNDEQSWLYGNVDVILPSVYGIYPVVPTEGDVTQSADKTGLENATYILANAEEGRRLRDAYATGAKVLMYTTAFIENASITEFHTPLNEIAADQGVRMARYGGADGIIMWGYPNNCATCGTTCGSDDALCAEEWTDILDDLWKPIILDVWTDCP